MNQTAIPTPATTATGAPVIAKTVIVMAAATIAVGGSGGGGGEQPSDNTEASKDPNIGVQEC
ncbi:MULTISPECIES: hypothetical protein [unclassified Microcoleus]|uniref:hypothetical protein n=1 Tax=unclassified Microcoleus TaxID=2642155 RepID=UPI002FD53E51